MSETVALADTTRLDWLEQANADIYVGEGRVVVSFCGTWVIAASVREALDIAMYGHSGGQRK